MMSKNSDLVNEFKEAIGNVLNEDVDQQSIINIHVTPDGVSGYTILDIAGEERSVEKGKPHGFYADEMGNKAGNYWHFVDMPEYKELDDEENKLKEISIKVDEAVKSGKFTPDEASEAKKEVNIRLKEIKKEKDGIRQPWDRFMPWFIDLLKMLDMKPYPVYGFKNEDTWEAWDTKHKDFPDRETYLQPDSGRIPTKREFDIYDKVPDNYIPPKSYIPRHVKIEVGGLGSSQKEAFDNLWTIMNHDKVEKLDWMVLRKAESIATIQVMARIEEPGYEDLAGHNIGRPAMKFKGGETVEFPDEVVEKGESIDDVKARLARSSMNQNAAIKSKLASEKAKRAYLSNIEKKTDTGEFQDQIDIEVNRIAQEAEDYFGVDEEVTKKAIQKLLNSYGLPVPDIEFITSPQISKEAMKILKGSSKKKPLDALDIRSLLEHAAKWASAVINDDSDVNRLYGKLITESNYASGKFDSIVDSVVYEIKSNKIKIESYTEIFDEDVLKSIDMAIDGKDYGSIIESCGEYLSEDQVTKLNNQIFEGENLLGIRNHIDAVLKSRELVEHSNFLFGSVVHNLGIGDIKYFSDLVPSNISGPDYSDLSSFLQDRGIDYESIVIDAKEGNVISKNIIVGGI